MGLASSSCSACESKSAATYLAGAVSSATTQISLGPAIISIATSPYTHFLARATNILPRSEEHTSELQSRGHLVCRLLLEKKNSKNLSLSILCYSLHHTSV